MLKNKWKKMVELFDGTFNRAILVAKGAEKHTKKRISERLVDRRTRPMGATVVVVALLAAVTLVASLVVVFGGGDAELVGQPPVDSLEPREMADLPSAGGAAIEQSATKNSPVDYGPENTASRILVQLEEGVDPASLVAENGVVAGGEILEVLSALGNVVVVGLPDGVSADQATETLSVENTTTAGVISVEADDVVSLASSGSQVGSVWGLNRIDQPTLPLDTVYNYRSNGTGVVAYVVDSGLRSSHAEFVGRVQAGYSVISDGRGTEECTGEAASSYSGHGTHVAGTIGGSTYGVAKGVTIVPVRVFDCSGSGSWAGVASAVNWIVANHPTNNPSSRGIVNMSLSGGTSSTADAAVNSALSSGLPVVVAAGNDNTDACTRSPARVPNAVTVAAIGTTGSADYRASFSNYGACLDVFAPGVDIASSHSASDEAVYAWAGTSMAAPHVTGVAAQLLALNNEWTPAQVATEITTTAAVDLITDAGANSPNRLLFANPNIAASADTTPQSYHSLVNSTHSFHTTPGTPATLYKRTISSNTVAASLAFNSGENAISSAIISPDGLTGYFAVSGAPAKIVKINLSNMTRTADLTLNTTENYAHTAIISSDGIRGYFSTGDAPAKIVTVNLTDMTRMASSALTYADGIPRSAVRVGSSGLFGTSNSPGNIILFTLSSVSATRNSTLTLQSGENDLRSAVAVPASSTALFGTNTAPGKVVQVTVGNGVERKNVLTLASGNDYLVAATVAPNAANAYFSTNTSPGRVVKVPTGL